MTKIHRNKSLVLLSILLTMATSTFALTYDIYNDLESFTNATQNTSLHDFESNPIGTNYKAYDFGDFTVNGTSLYSVQIIELNTHKLYFNTSSYTQHMSVTFHSPIKAFGFDWRNDDNNNDMVRVVFDGTMYVLGAKDESGFWGVVVTEGEITSDMAFRFGDTSGGSGWTVGNLDNFRYSPIQPSTISGVVLDTVTAQPLENVEVTYYSERYELWQNDITNANGEFSLTGLRDGPAEIKARPSIDSTYSWNLPWLINYISLTEGENRTHQIIALQKGALVTGFVKDSLNQQIADIDIEWTGKMCDGWMKTDQNGYYEIRLPIGDYKISINSEDDNLGTTGATVTVTDVNQHINVNDIIVYSEQTGKSISGSIINPGAYPKTGFFGIIAFKTGTIINPENLYTTIPVSETGLEQADSYTLTSLPPDYNYDLYLVTVNETEDDIESLSIRDAQFNIEPGTANINLYYTSEGSTLTGTVQNIDSYPILGAYVILTQYNNGQFAAFTNTDENGNYLLYNIPAGQYAITTTHSMYQNTSTTSIIEVTDTETLNISTIPMPFIAKKEATNLNGDGFVNMLDYAILAESWMTTNSLEADFNQNGTVEAQDLFQITETWLYQPIWYNN